MLRLAGGVRDAQFRETVRTQTLTLVERLDLFQLILEGHLVSSKALAAEEASQRRALEKSLRTMAKRNYRMKVRLQNVQRLLTKDLPAPPPDRTIDEAAAVERLPQQPNILDVDLKQRRSAKHADERGRRLAATLLASGFSDEEEGPETSSASSDGRSISDAETSAADAADEFFDVVEEAASAVQKGPSGAMMLPGEQEAAPEKKAIVRRTELPKPRAEIRVSLWSILKDCIGKDLSRISMPVYFNEPTSFLQRLAEDFQYAHLLKEAARCRDPVERMLWLAVFTASPYASTVGRTFKPFNPLLGETFELSHRGFKFFAEQVGHHPPITAYSTSADEFEAFGHLIVKNRFTGKSLEVTLPGASNVILHLKAAGSAEEKEHFAFQRAKGIVNNVIFGKLSLEMFGTVLITSHTCGTCAFIEYLRPGWWSREMHVVRGLVFDAEGRPHWRLGGWWSRELWVEELVPEANAGLLTRLSAAVDVPGPGFDDWESTTDSSSLNCATPPYPAPKFWARNIMDFRVNWDALESKIGTRRVIWRPEPRGTSGSKFYEFSQMAMELNDISEDYDIARGAHMPPTDSRYRPDQRLLEMAEFERANVEKSRLEEKQRRGKKKISFLVVETADTHNHCYRAAARLRARDEVEYRPRWFVPYRDAITSGYSWRFTGEYWDAKARNEFVGCMDIL